MKNKSNKFNRIALITPFMILTMTGCSTDTSDLYNFIDEVKASGVGSVRPIPQFKPYQNFVYAANDLRDPFVSHVDINEDQSMKKDSLHPENNRPKQHLEIFPLDTLSMVGTLEQVDNSWGLIKDPQNIVHRVKLGNYLGQNEGRITKITETKIYLTEIISDGIGGYIERDVSIAVGNE